MGHSWHCEEALKQHTSVRSRKKSILMLFVRQMPKRHPSSPLLKFLGLVSASLRVTFMTQRTSLTSSRKRRITYSWECLKPNQRDAILEG